MPPLTRAVQVRAGGPGGLQGPCEELLASLGSSMLDSPGSSGSQGRLTAIKGAEDNSSPSPCPTLITLSWALRLWRENHPHHQLVGCGALVEMAEGPVTPKKHCYPSLPHMHLLSL